MAARRRFRWVLVALGALAIALVLFVVLHRKPAPPPKPPAVPVVVARVSVQDVPVSITAIGVAQAWRSDIILAQVSGKLLSVPFREGADVRAGELLAQVDPAPYRAALMQAQGALKRDQALLAAARVDLARYRTLAAQDSIARQTLDTQAALVKQDEGIVLADEGAVAAAQTNLRFTRIVAPISGRAGPSRRPRARSSASTMSRADFAGRWRWKLSARRRAMCWAPVWSASPTIASIPPPARSNSRRGSPTPTTTSGPASSSPCV
jgi:multidrug efflux system membrane fusion protein